MDGRKFSNYSDYPRSQQGRITLRTALAQSCNTAFIGQRGKLDQSSLAEAAGSLGFGIDYDVGFPSYFGSVPNDPTATGRAAAMIGQGKVQASPMTMAAVVASVAAGETVIPHLVDGQQATSKGKPLTDQEARQLREMMRAVVAEGSGRVLGDLPGPAVLAKTGTAEYGTSKPLKTHAWMIAAQGDLAVAVFVNDGKSGSVHGWTTAADIPGESPLGHTRRWLDHFRGPPTDCDQPSSLVTFHETGGLECGQGAQAGWHTDAGGEGDVSDGGATASRNGFEDCELVLGQCIGRSGLTVGEWQHRLTHVGDQLQDLRRRGDQHRLPVADHQVRCRRGPGIDRTRDRHQGASATERPASGVSGTRT